MKFAVSYNSAFLGTDPDRIVEFARHAEACGFQALYVPEHVVLYPGATLGPAQIPTSLPILDPLDCLSFVAAATESILLGTAVLLLPLHHPVVLAKRVATIDVLSKGRMRLLTVGVGSLEGEARALGVDFATRGRRADEAIDVLRLLWSGGEQGVSFHGEFFDLDRVCSFPKPYRTTAIPIHIGGSSRPAARRAGRRGDGFFPGGALTAAERTHHLELARAAAREAGRDPEALEYTRWGSIEATVDEVETLAAQGVTRLVVNPTSAEPEHQREQMSAFAERLRLRP